MMKWDGHTHSPFCKHGSAAPMEQYVQEALRQQFVRLTVTEHAPLPERWVDDDALMRELAMSEEEMESYIATVVALKCRYRGLIDVCVGLEIDHLPGRTSYTEQLLARAGEDLEEMIVSVHYVAGRRGAMHCIDYTPDDVKQNLLPYYGSMDRLMQAYYDEVECAISTAGQWSGVKVRPDLRMRLGHVDLIDKFRSVLPPFDEAHRKERLLRLLPLLVRYRMGIDVNTAGLRKPFCQQMYVQPFFIEACIAQGVPLVFGSDAHDPNEVGAHWSEAQTLIHEAKKVVFAQDTHQTNIRLG